MTNEEKAAKYDDIQKELWNLARHGNVLQSTLASVIILRVDIPSPEGDEPDDA